MRHPLKAFFIALFLLAGSAFAAEPAYKELASPAAVSVPGKIEVVELFWYGCGHCYEFEPYIDAWTKNLPPDVNFVRLPALFGKLWDIHGQLFFALEALNAPHSVHQAIFDAIHKEGKILASPDEMADFLAAQGIDKEALLKAYNSFGVKAQMEKAKKRLLSYQVSGVPTLVVDGKYVFGVGQAGGAEAALQLADELIAKERAQVAQTPTPPVPASE